MIEDSSAPVFELRGIRKTFPGVVALDDVGFSCRAGEVHALVGENGAGKSTLMKVLSGAYRADAGTILIDGREARFTHPAQALAAGIAVIYQEFALLPQRTVAQNVFLGREPTRGLRLDDARMLAETQRVLALFGSVHTIEPGQLVGELSVAEQQMVEIAKAVALDAKVIVMDEPTAALDGDESDILFSLIERLRGQRRAIVYITHRLREISRLADRVTVLKDGRVAAAFDAVPDPAAIVHAMVGRDIGDFYPSPTTAAEQGAIVVSVRGGGNRFVDAIDLDFVAGEIVGFAGIQGAGRAALARALFGEAPFERGEMKVSDSVVSLRSPRDAIRAGICMLPGDRKAEGMLMMQSVLDNAMLAARALARRLGSNRRNPHIDRDGAARLLGQLDIRAASLEQPIGGLSGGNQQKAIVARWLALAPAFLIFLEPTRGIDVNAKAGIYRLMRELANAGAAIMMVSSDLPEVLGVADRIVVMREGRISARFARGASEADVMRAATGAVDELG